jgi:UDP-glucose 4-epimerase
MTASSDSHHHRPTVLATGVAGYIGSHFALACLEAGWRVIGVDDLSVGSQTAVPDGVEFYRMDCGDPRIADLIRDTDAKAAVHFAALISVEESFDRPEDYYETNVSKALRFFVHASQAGVGGIVFSSTAAVYGEAGNEPVDEAAPLAPKSPYGRTKLATEWLLGDVAARHEVPHVVLRYFNVAGADPKLRTGPRPGATHLIKIVAEAATGQRDEVVINGDDFSTPDGTAVRDYIHASDLADAHVAAVRHLLEGGDNLTLNVGYGSGYSVREVIDTATELARNAFGVRVGPRRTGDIESLVADPSALRNRLGWTPCRADLSLILQTAIDWEIRQLNDERMIAIDHS